MSLQVWLSLRILSFSSKVHACRFTNFIVRSANGIARFWSGQMIGKARSAHIVIQPNFRRSFLFLLPVLPVLVVRVALNLRAPGRQAPVECVEQAGRIRTEAYYKHGARTFLSAAMCLNKVADRSFSYIAADRNVRAPFRSE